VALQTLELLLTLLLLLPPLTPEIQLALLDPLALGVPLTLLTPLALVIPLALLAPLVPLALEVLG